MGTSYGIVGYASTHAFSDSNFTLYPYPEFLVFKAFYSNSSDLYCSSDNIKMLEASY